MNPPQSYEDAINALVRKGYRVTRNGPDSTGWTCYLVKRCNGYMNLMGQVEWIEETGQVLSHS